MSEKRKINPRPEPSYGTVNQDDGFGVAILMLILGFAAGAALCIFVLATAERPQPDVWAEIDRDFSACIVRGIDEMNCHQIALEMAGINIELDCVE